MAKRKKTTRRKLAPVVRELTLSKKTYSALLADMKARIQSAQYEALRAVNKELVGLYWDIGQLLVERQEIQGWGKSIVEAGGRPASRVPRYQRIFGLESLADEGLFRNLPRPPKTRTTGARNCMEP